MRQHGELTQSGNHPRHASPASPHHQHPPYASFHSQSFVQHTLPFLPGCCHASAETMNGRDKAEVLAQTSAEVMAKLAAARAAAAAAASNGSSSSTSTSGSEVASGTGSVASATSSEDWVEDWRRSDAKVNKYPDMREFTVRPGLRGGAVRSRRWMERETPWRDGRWCKVAWEEATGGAGACGGCLCMRWSSRPGMADVGYSIGGEPVEPAAQRPWAITIVRS